MSGLHFGELSEFRKQLHSSPDLSGMEEATAAAVIRFLEPTRPDFIVHPIGRTGIIACYDSKSPGPTIAFRCELDGLPIQESEGAPHRSQRPGHAHLCGHDGHMAIVCGLGKYYGNQRPSRGKIMLLFQAAEETGEGAEWLIRDDKYASLAIDYVFGLHNLPGKPLHTVIARSGTLCAASTGIIISLDGETSHAAEPWNGLSPGVAMAELIIALQGLLKRHSFSTFTLLTIIHAVLGEMAFGTSPGHAEVRATLRSYTDEDLNRLIELVQAEATDIASRHKMRIQFELQDAFAATVNTEESFARIQRAAQTAGLAFETSPEPFKWSEDFGRYRQVANTGFFCLGAGETQPPLHRESYDFPDALLSSGTKMFIALAEELMAGPEA